MPLPVRVAAVVSLSFIAADCRCLREPKREGAPVFERKGVFALTDARASTRSVLVATRAVYDPHTNTNEEAIALSPEGKELWRSPPSARALLGPDATSPVIVVESLAAAATRRLSLLDSATGQRTRSFEVPGKQNLLDVWTRDGSTLFLAERKSLQDPVTLVAIDVARSLVLWTRETGINITIDPASLIPQPALVTKTHLYVFCQPIPAVTSYEYDLCKFSRTTGALEDTLKGPILDAACSKDNGVVLLRASEIEALSAEGQSLWKKSIAEPLTGFRLASHDDWLVVLTQWVRSKNSVDYRALALDATSGHTLWSKEGERFGFDLAMGGNYALASMGPELRLLNRHGERVLGIPLATEFVSSTDVFGSFTEPLRGIFIAPPYVLTARDKHGLQAFQIP
jgi:outer membrane protein assembly factor BamB